MPLQKETLRAAEWWIWLYEYQFLLVNLQYSVSIWAACYFIHLELIEHWGQRWISSVALLLLHQSHVLIHSGAVLPHPANANKHEKLLTRLSEQGCRQWFKCKQLNSLLQEPFTNSITHSVQVGVGRGVQGGKGLCSPPVRSDKEYLMLVYSRPLILLFCRGENRGRLRDGSRNKR